MSDYIPARDEEFALWVENYMAVLAAGLTQWDIKAEAFAPVQDRMAAWRPAWAAYRGPNHGKIDTLNKKQAQRALKGVIRLFNKAQLLYNPLVTNEDKGRLGLRVYQEKRRRADLTETKVGVTITVDLRSVIIHYREEGSERRGRPPEARGVEISFAVLDGPWRGAAAVAGELVRSVFSTRSPYTFTFAEGDRRKIFYCRLRWVNNHTAGPWSETYSATVP